MNITLVLTSTVNINEKKIFLTQRNKNERIDVYVKSVLQWLKKNRF